MNLSIVDGPKNDWEDHPISLGKLFYSALKNGEPDKVIMVQEDSGERITNNHLLRSGLCLAQYLQRSGLTRDDVISVISINSWKYFSVFIAGFLLGIPINCVNSGYSEEELVKSFAITEPSFVICSLNCLKRIENVRKSSSHKIKDLIILDDLVDDHYISFREIINRDECDEILIPDFDPKNTVALIMFSSGTSGHPKAVMLTHHSVRNSFGNIGDPNYFNHNKNSITIAVLPLFHFFGIFINFSAIFCQSMSVILTSFQPQHFLSTIDKYKATHLYVVPMLMMFFAKSPIMENYSFNSVKTIICGAAPVGPKVQKSIEEKFINADIKQVYGLTECASPISLPNKSMVKTKIGSSGVILKGMTVKIVDPKTENIVPLGERGEIRIKSVANMKGYLKNPIETNKSFDCNGFLKTGDLGYFDNEGVLFIVDRVKEIIKYKGFQVSPSELEDLLKKHKGVADAAVVGKFDENFGELPTAFVIKNSRVNVSEEELIQYIAEHISKEKRLYGGVIFTDNLPRNPTGKVLRRLLRETLNQQ